MFSGIIKGLEKPNKITKVNKGIRMEINIPQGWKIAEGDSISLDGVCTTVEKVKKETFETFLMHETLDKSTLGSIDGSHYLNMELPLRLNDLVGGHLVSGHVDTTARVTTIVDEIDSRVLSFEMNKKYTKYVIYKGSICINGVSLTVTQVSKSSFSVALIPYTLKQTNLGRLKKGDMVNIELDLVAKYIEKLAS